MAIQLTLTATPDHHLLAHLGDEAHPLTAPTPLTDLPRIDGDSNPFRLDPYGLGERLFAAMGGAALTDLLDQDDENLLLLITDERTAGFPWEFAATPERALLVEYYAVLRLLPQARKPRPAQGGPLNLVVLAADPLVDPQGRPFAPPTSGDPARDATATRYRLDLTTELDHIRRTLDQAERAVLAQRIPPTAAHLRRALRRGPAILHLSCHGSVIRQTDGQTISYQPVLYLEDAQGAADILRGDDLTRLPSPGVLRLVVLSACRTAAAAESEGPGGDYPLAGEANLARALVLSGSTPAAIGMQANFPDPLSAPFAENFYDSLLLGDGDSRAALGEGLRQARLALEDPATMGLPVAYIAPAGEQPFPLSQGRAETHALDFGRFTNLPPSLAPPETFLGREETLYHLAQAFETNRVVTVVGSGGMGKTALSAAFAARFGWSWPGGVIGLSLADQPNRSAATLLHTLLTRLLGPAQLQQHLPDTGELPGSETLLELLLAEAPRRDPLLLIDNYETILQALDENGAAGAEADPLEVDPAEAQILHRALHRLAAAGVALLLTSRRQPAGFPGERVFPSAAGGAGLAGLSPTAGTRLFLHHSSRTSPDDPAHRELARRVAQETAGHPLAITLLAAEFDLSGEQTPATFLAGWGDELAAAQHRGLPPHHATFETAFGRSFRALTPAQQGELLVLGRFVAPFFAEGAALLWGEPLPAAQDTDEAAQTAREGLHARLQDLVRRSLLLPDRTYSDGSPATYRLEPVIARTLRHRLSRTPAPEQATQSTAYAAYAAWLANYAYGDIHRDSALAQLVHDWQDELPAQAAHQPPAGEARYCRQVAWLLTHYGRLSEALTLLAQGQSAARRAEDQATLSSLLFEEARIQVTRGALDEALGLYEESLRIDEGLGDLQGKGATLHAMASVYVTRGALDEALGLYEESLRIKEGLGDLKGKGATLHAMASVYVTRGALDEALGHV